MSTRTPARPLRPAHRITAAIAAALLLGGIVLGGTGIASAAVAASRAFILGRSNFESSTAKLSDSRGTPLSLSAPRNKAPLAVNRSVMVKNLNAQYLGGLRASSVEFTGGDGIAAPNARRRARAQHQR